MNTFIGETSTRLLQFSFMFNIILGYKISYLPAVICVYARILIARHYGIKKLVTVSIIRFVTLGLLLAAPISCFTGTPAFIIFFVPFYFAAASALDYLLARIFLKAYPKRDIFFMILYSNLIVMALSVIGFLLIDILWK